jgi:hypothetical protein
MSKRRLRNLHALLYVVSGTTMIASAAPAPLDSQARAQAALAVPLYLDQTLSQDVISLAGGAQRTARLALKWLAEATSYDAIAASPTGVTVACPASGTLLAHATSAPPRVVQIDFQACALQDAGLVFEFTGAQELTLFRKSLAPASVAGIRLGTADQDLVERFYFADSPANPQIRLRNMNLTGNVPIQLDDSGFEVVGPLDYHLTGFYQFANSRPLPDGSMASTGLRFEAENFSLSGHRHVWRLNELQVFDYSFQYSGGTVSSTYFDTQAGISDRRSVSLGTLSVIDYSIWRGNDWQSWLDVNGVANVTWAAGNGAGCVSGEYDIETSKPWFYSSVVAQPWLYQYIDGASRINDSVSVRFGAHPTPNTRLNVRGVGNFRYTESVQNLVSALPCSW